MPSLRKNDSKNTLPKFNMGPENDGFQKGISYSRVPFSGSMLNFWEGSRLGLVGINQLPMFKHEASQVCLATDLIAQQEAMGEGKREKGSSWPIEIHEKLPRKV